VDPAGRRTITEAKRHAMVKSGSLGIWPACSTTKAIHVAPELPPLDRRRPHPAAVGTLQTNLDPQGQRHSTIRSLPVQSLGPWSVSLGEGGLRQPAAPQSALSCWRAQCPQRR